MRNVDGKRQSKRVNFGWKWDAVMVCNYLKRLAIPTGFEPVTIGLEGRKPMAVYSRFTNLAL
jgi:hypothetical protein